MSTKADKARAARKRREADNHAWSVAGDVTRDEELGLAARLILAAERYHQANGGIPINAVPSWLDPEPREAAIELDAAICAIRQEFNGGKPLPLPSCRVS